MKIIAVLLNPTIDQIYEIENFQVGGTFKIQNSIIYPVGKAISFSIGVQELSNEVNSVKIIACIGKDEIKLYSNFLESRKIDFQFIEINGKTRSNKTINDPIRGTTTHIREKGLLLEKKDLEVLIDIIERTIEKGDMVVFSGSIPPNIDKGIYYKMINICKQKAAMTTLDTSSNALIEGIKSNPTIIKPNLVELSQILQDPTLIEFQFANIKDSCKILVDKAKSLLNEDLEIILITLGKNGAICLTKDRAYYGNVHIDNVIDTVGSGDSFLSGFIYFFSKNETIISCFKSAIASGAANTLIPGPGLYTKNDYENILKKVDIRVIK